MHKWEEREANERLAELHTCKRQLTFCLGSIARIALAVNESDPVLAGELLDIIDDAKQFEKRVGREA